MEPAEYERSFRHEETNWLEVGFAAFDRRVLERHGALVPPFLDAGCGTGGWLAELRRHGHGEGYGCDRFPDALARAKRRGLRRLVQGSIERLPYRTGTFRTVTCRHVIEHVENDEAALAELHRVLAPGGRLLLGVPAGSWIWTAHDVANHHLRRYDLAPLLERLRRHGFAIEFATPINLAALPAAAALTLFERVRPTPPAKARRLHVAPPGLNRILSAVFRAELLLARRRLLPAGLSLVVLARRER